MIRKNSKANFIFLGRGICKEDKHSRNKEEKKDQS